MSYKLKLYISALYTNCIIALHLYGYNQSQKIGKGKELTEEERAFIVGTAKGGIFNHKDSRGDQETPATILTRFRSRGNFQTAKCFGRPSITTQRDERSLTRLVREDRMGTSKGFGRKVGCNDQENSRRKDN